MRLSYLFIFTGITLLSFNACHNKQKNQYEENPPTEESTAWLPDPVYQPGDPAVAQLIDSATLLQVSAKQEPGLRPEERQARLQRAKAQLGQVLQLDPQYGNAYSNMAAIYLEEGDTATSIRYLQKRLEIEPRLIQGWLFLGTLYDLQRDSLQAFEHYEQALELVNDRLAMGKDYANPADVAYYYDNWALKTQCLLMLGRKEAARKELQQLIEQARPVLGEQVRSYEALGGFTREDLLGR